MFYENVSSGQAKQWMAALKADKDLVLFMSLRTPIEVETYQGGYADADIIVMQCRFRNEVSVRYEDVEGNVLNGGSYDYETAEELMSIETEAAGGADCELDYLDDIIDG